MPHRLRISIAAAILLWVVLDTTASKASETVVLESPDGQNRIRLEANGQENGVKYSVSHRRVQLIDPSAVRPILVEEGSLTAGARVVNVHRELLDKSFKIPWGKTTNVVNRCSRAVVTLATETNKRWEIELRAYDDGVAFRYRIPAQDGLVHVTLREEMTEFRPAGTPQALYNTLDGFNTSHESLYERRPLDSIPIGRLVDMPMLLIWPDRTAAAITEARVLNFAGMYLERPTADGALRSRLSPLPSNNDACVTVKPPLESPWRVILLGDSAGKLHESNLTLCLNDPPQGDFQWARPGKTTFHWWYGEFEDFYKRPEEPGAYFEKHKEYIDFCAANNIAYHSVSGDGRAWYLQSDSGYGTPAHDADVCKPRPELELSRIIDYAKQRGVGIRLWVHWKPLSEQLEEAFTLYESWGIKGLMVDFLNRDDQEMIDFSERMLQSAARHKLHIQIHGSSKFSGEQRTYPNLFNREGVLNLEYLKSSDLCTPAHNVNVAYTRALAGPVDYHLGGFRAVSRREFRPRDRAPTVMGTRCHQLALYVVYENPMPMVADAPKSYEGQAGFEFVRKVPTTWDETRFLNGEAGQYLVIARRSGTVWYLAGITDWTQRDVDVPLDALGRGDFVARLLVDGSMDRSKPNAINKISQRLNARTPLHVSMASGGGFVAILQPE